MPQSPRRDRSICNQAASGEGSGASHGPLQPGQGDSRRSFLAKSSAAMVGGGLVASLGGVPRVHAAGTEKLKVGLVGCGGRGRGAASNILEADEQTTITALADAFPDPIDFARKTLERTMPGRSEIADERCFSGFDAYKQILETDIDIVLLCTPPHFRPAHLRAAIEAGKHVFCEKPVAVDGPGVRHVLETTRMAKEKDRSIVSGLCWRYHNGVRETVKRIQDGAIGDIVAIQENYLTQTLRYRERRPEWSDMEHQIRNWTYFTWLSGDHIVEQHIHSLDKSLWLMGDKPPVKCFGLGGRQARIDPKYGDVYDHFAVCYEWESGVKTFAYTRQMQNCGNDVEDYVLGTEGRAKILAHQIEGRNPWSYDGPKPRSMYVQEHAEMVAAIRAGKPLNNGDYMSYSTLMAIMGREACYTGQEITSAGLLASDVRLGPETYAWGEAPPVDIAIPGRKQG